MKKLNSKIYSFQNNKIVYTCDTITNSITREELCSVILPTMASCCNSNTTIKLYILANENLDLRLTTGVTHFIQFLQQLQNAKKAVYESFNVNIKIHVVWFNRTKYTVKKHKKLSTNANAAEFERYKSLVYLFSNNYLKQLFKKYNISFEGKRYHWWQIEDKYFIVDYNGDIILKKEERDIF